MASFASSVVHGRLSANPCLAVADQLFKLFVVLGRLPVEQAWRVWRRVADEHTVARLDAVRIRLARFLMGDGGVQELGILVLGRHVATISRGQGGGGLDEGVGECLRHATHLLDLLRAKQLLCVQGFLFRNFASVCQFQLCRFRKRR